MPEREAFHLGAWVFDVTRALEITITTPATTIAVDLIRPIAGLIWVNPSAVSRADMSRPILLAYVPEMDGYLPIDGWHRIHRAIRDGIRELPAVRLTKQQSESVRMKISRY